MLKEKIDMLYRLLDCNNSDIARILGCSPSGISRIRNGSRGQNKASRSILRFAEGIYRYADNTGAAAALCKLCNVTDDSPENVIPALASWLFDASETNLPSISPAGSSKRTAQKQKKRFFGEKLDAVMELLDLSNIRLAQKINVDASTVSRFRKGVRSPKPPISTLLVEELLTRAHQQDKMQELGNLCELPEKELSESIDAFSSWLYSNEWIPDISGIGSLLESIEQFPAKDTPMLPDIHAFATDEILSSNELTYWGTEGLRTAVIRFLGTAAKEGGELLLYSDQNIDWMVGDPIYQLKWFSMMTACIRSGVKIRIIHNIDRGISEMISAIQSWLPLYMSGMIEPYVCQLGRDARFSKTIFLRPGNSCILSSLLRGTESTGRYEYLTDKRELNSVESEFNGLLANSAPLIKITFDNYFSPFEEDEKSKHLQALLTTFSLGTMPKATLHEILERNKIGEEERCRIEKSQMFQRDKLEAFLSHGKVTDFLVLPSDDTLFEGKVRVDLTQALCDKKLFYTSEEYAAHIRAILERMEQNENYDIIFLPELPFLRLHIIVTDNLVTVIRSEKPYAAIIFSEPRMVRSFLEYFTLLRKQYQIDRNAVRQKLMRFL